MIRMNPRRLDSVRKTLVEIDRIFVNIHNTNNQTRIYELENKMNEKSVCHTSDPFDKIYLRNMISPSSQKHVLKTLKGIKNWNQ